MIEALISSKTRVSLLVKFFLNKDNRSYLRGLANEFNESTNSIRLELNRFENAGLLLSNKERNKKIYRANTKHPLFNEINQIVRKHTRVEAVVDRIVNNLGEIQEVYLTGELARGKDTGEIELLIVGNPDINEAAKLSKKASKLLKRKIEFEVVEGGQISQDCTKLLVWKNIER